YIFKFIALRQNTTLMLCSVYLPHGILQHDPLSNMRTLTLALQRVYMTRACAYRDALNVFMVGYQEGIQQVRYRKADPEPSVQISIESYSHLTHDDQLKSLFSGQKKCVEVVIQTTLIRSHPSTISGVEMSLSFGEL
ncbi:hypothetical protein Tco_0849854, partial [Tanacetum coccineum]